MRRHAKASTAGSTQRQARGLGRFFRGADATRGDSLDSRGSSAPTARRLALPVLAFALLAMALTAAPASATIYVPEGPFGSAAQPVIDTPLGLAVDQSTGLLLALDQNPPVIKRFNPDGTPADFSALGTNVIDGEGPGDATPQGGLLGLGSSSESQIAVDNSGGPTDGNIYVALSGSGGKVVDIFASSGAYLGQLTAAGSAPFGESCGVAVDSSGVVYVGDFTNGIHKFVPTVNPPVDTDHVATLPVSTICTVAAGVGPSAGSIFATQYFGSVFKLDAETGATQYLVESDTSVTTYVDPQSGNLFVVTGEVVREYDASGGSPQLVSTIPVGGPDLDEPHGVAVGVTSGDVYVSKYPRDSNIEVFGLPPVHTGGASDIAATSATLNGRITPNGDAVEECFFEYGLAAPAYGQSVPCVETPASIGTGSNPVPVHADVSGLSDETAYHFRLVAKIGGNTTQGADNSFTTLALPVIKDTWADSVVVREATVKAKINPKGSPTTFHVEYGPTPAYGSSSPELSAGGDSDDHTVSALLANLEPGATYHYRFVASSPLGTVESADRSFKTFTPFVPKTDCPNQAFRIGASASLPDCRAYEMVSPVDKDGSDISTKATAPDNYWAQLNQSAESGNKFTYSANKAFGDAESSYHSTQYMSEREAGGWTTRSISPPHDARYSEVLSLLFETEYKFFSPDLSVGYLIYNDKFRRLTADAPPAEVVNVYKRDLTPGGGYQALITEETGLEPHGSQPPLPEPQAISRDGKHAALVMGVAPLTPDADPGSNAQTYLWSEGELHLVSVLPDGTANPTNSEAGSANHTGQANTRLATVTNAVSDDGSRVFWTAQGGKLYLRENAQAEPSASGACDEPGKACTLQVGGPGSAQFVAADPTGDTALYEEGAALFKFDVASETRTLIASQLPQNGGMLGASDNLSRIYFLSKADLADGAIAGEPNLYLFDEGVYTLVAVLAEDDIAGGINSFSAIPATRGGRVTSDGGHAAFMARSSLPTANFPDGYDNKDAATGVPAAEVYIYDADADELICASCNPSGARPSGSQGVELGPTGIKLSPVSAAWITPWNMQYYGQRALSDDGSRLFFNAFDALLPQDTNGKVDVYQWEAEGSGTCTEADGCISLLSSGKSTENSEFIDASPSGDDVFIRTESKLVPQDPGLIDAYDARVGGGFPSAAGVDPCEGEACQSPSAAPNDATPASANFRGAGNATPAKKRSRCRRQRTRAGKQQARSGKRKLAKPRACKRQSRRAAR